VSNKITEYRKKLKRLCNQKEYKERSVFLTNTGAKPRTVMIKSQNALIATMTVSGSQRLVELTQSTISAKLVHLLS